MFERIWGQRVDEGWGVEWKLSHSCVKSELLTGQCVGKGASQWDLGFSGNTTEKEWTPQQRCRDRKSAKCI